MFKRSNQKTEKSAQKERDSNKKPAQPKENDDCARQNVKVKKGATEEKCVAGPVVTRAQAKKSDKVHPLKVKEAMSYHQRELRRRVLQEEWIALPEASRNENWTKL